MKWLGMLRNDWNIYYRHSRNNQKGIRQSHAQAFSWLHGVPARSSIHESEDAFRSPSINAKVMAVRIKQLGLQEEGNIKIRKQRTSEGSFK